MRANRQLHDEVSKYFYKNWRLCARVGPALLGHSRRDYVAVNLQEAIPTINSATRELLKELEIRIYEHLRYAVITAPPPSPISNIFDIFKLERVHITFELSDTFRGRTEDTNMERFGKSLIKQIPASVSVSWSHKDAAAFFGSPAVEQRLYQALQDRVSPEIGRNVTVPERMVTQ
jgi:hypothetical protein